MKKLSLLLIILLWSLGIIIPIQGQNVNLPDVYTLKWDNHGTRLAIGYGVGKITILDVITGIETNIGELTTGNILSVDWHPTNDDLILIGISQNPYWRMYDVSTNQLLYYGDVGSTSVTNVSWNADGTLIASAANWVRDNLKIPRVDIWNPINCNLNPYEYNGYFIMECPLITSFEHSYYIHDVRWHPTDPFKLVSGEDGEVVRFWDINLNGEYRPPIFADGGGTKTVWNHDGSQIAITLGGDDRCAVGLWNVDEITEEPFRQFEVECYMDIAWKSDGSLAISEDSNINITDVEAREIFETLELTSQNVPRFVNGLDWSINGDLAIGGPESALLYFKPNTYYIVDEASDFANFIEMANANTSMNMFDMRGDFDLTAPLPIITGDITIIGDESQLTTLRESDMLSVGEGGQLSFEIRENEEGA